MKKVAILLVPVFIILINYSFAQEIIRVNFPNVDSTCSQKKDSAKKDFYVKGAVTVTNKGISYIPNLSLGKPALIFDLTMANKKLSFEPQLRFSLTGEPWTFLFPVRCKIKATGKFQLAAGVNPLLNFKNVTYTVNSVSTTELVNRRYLGGELRPNYFFTKNISAGIVYLYFYGVSDRTVQHTNFISINTIFSNITLGRKFFAKFNPQLYYLKQDGKEGFYVNSIITLLKRDFPFSIQSNMNAAIQTNIPGSEDFIWNVSLIYSFNKTYNTVSNK